MINPKVVVFIAKLDKNICFCLCFKKNERLKIKKRQHQAWLAIMLFHSLLIFQWTIIEYLLQVTYLGLKDSSVKQQIPLVVLYPWVFCSSVSSSVCTPQPREGVYSIPACGTAPPHWAWCQIWVQMLRSWMSCRNLFYFSELCHSHLSKERILLGSIEKIKVTYKIAYKIFVTLLQFNSEYNTE